MSNFKHVWKCPYCDAGDNEKWNKSCYYKLIDHIKDKHLDKAFSDMVCRFKTESKKQLIDSRWRFFRKCIKSTKIKGKDHD